MSNLEDLMGRFNKGNEHIHNIARHFHDAGKAAAAHQSLIYKTGTDLGYPEHEVSNHVDDFDANVAGPLHDSWHDLGQAYKLHGNHPGLALDIVKKAVKDYNQVYAHVSQNWAGSRLHDVMSSNITKLPDMVQAYHEAVNPDEADFQKIAANTCADPSCGKPVLEHNINEYASHGNFDMSQAKARRLFSK